MQKEIWPIAGSLAGAIIVAVTVWYNGSETRRRAEEHDKLMATPTVLPIVSDGALDERWGIYLRNEGDARAEINYRAVKLDNKLSDMATIVQQMRKEGLLRLDAKVEYLDLKSGSLLGRGGVKAILEGNTKGVKETEKKKFNKFIHQRIEIRFEACSMYQECVVGCTKSGCK